MILGIFGGVTPVDIVKRLDKVDDLYAKIDGVKADIRTQLAKGVADRTAAIKELQDELASFASLRERL